MRWPQVGEFGWPSGAIRPLAHVELQGLTGSYALLLAKPNAAGGVDIVGSLSEVGEAMVSAFILRMAKQRVRNLSMTLRHLDSLI